MALYFKMEVTYTRTCTNYRKEVAVLKNEICAQIARISVRYEHQI